MVYRNVEQLELHLAALENGVGKDSGCKSADIAVRDLMRIGISAREAKQDRARQQSEHRKAVEKAQDLVEPKRKSIQPFITASMASSTVRAFCCDTALLIRCTCLLVKSTTSASVLERAARKKVSKESGVFERDQTAPWGWLGPLRL